MKPGRLLLLGLLGTTLLFASCDEQPEECEREDVGALEFVVIPDLEGAAEPLVQSFTATVVSVDELFTNPPVIEYTLRRESGPDVVIQTNDMGYTIPVTVGNTYDVVIQKGTVIEFLLHGWSVAFSDDQGLAALVVTDWEPGFSVYPDGREEVQELVFPTEDLRIQGVDAGCDARVENTNRFLDIVNRKVAVNVGVEPDQQRIQLYHGDAGAVGPYTVQVFRAERARAKDNILNVILQYSFAVVRTELVP